MEVKCDCKTVMFWCRPLVKDFPTAAMPCIKAPVYVTAVNVQKAVGLEKKQGTRSKPGQ